MPSRYIRVRKMKEQESDQGDTLAVAAAMQIVGASYVETLDTKGTDGSNVTWVVRRRSLAILGELASPMSMPFND